MICEITRKLEDNDLEKIRSLEGDLGLMLVAFSCRSLDPAREEKLQRIMDELGPMLQAPVAHPDDSQLAHIRELEEELGVALIAVDAGAS
jgi:hypothetical protein